MRTPLIAALLLVPLIAEARFGKASPPPPGESKKEPEKSQKKEEPREPEHEATAVAPAPQPAPVYEPAHEATPVRPAPCCVEYPPPPPPRRYRPVVVVTQPRVKEPPGKGRVEIGLTGQIVEEGTAGGLTLTADGERAGFFGEYTGLVLRADDGSNDVDRIHLLDAHLTFGLVATERIRVRAHLGADLAAAPDVTMVGPSAGLSATLLPGGPLVLEAGAELTPWPFLQLDGRAALGLQLGPVELKGGYRVMVLNDQGRAGDGVVHQDVFAGPYVGLSLVF